MSTEMDTFALLAKCGDNIPISSIELWLVHGACDYHWMVTFFHPSGNTTSVSRETTEPIRWITDIPQERANTRIKFQVTYECPELRRLASRVFNAIENREYTCYDFAYFLLWDYKRCGYIDNQIDGILAQMVTIVENLSAFRVSEHLKNYEQPLVESRPDIKVATLIFTPSNSHVLLVQRSAENSYPNKWEYPEGGVEAGDQSNNKSIILAAVHRCRKETQLHISDVVHVMDDDQLEGNVLMRKFTFIVNVHESKEAEDFFKKVILNPSKHQGFLWATRKDIEGMAETAFFWQQKRIILGAFDLMTTRV